MTPAAGKSLWLSLPLWLVVMVCANVTYNRWSAGSVLIGLAVTAVMAALALRFGLDSSDLGLARSTRMVGLRWGGAVLAVVGCGYLVALMIPAIRDAVGPSGGSWAHTLVAAFVVIPLGTVIPEEVAFRGVLWGLLRRSTDRWVATATSSAVFGMWHVLPALAGGSANQAVDAVVGDGTLGLLLRVAGTVLFTAAAGVFFCELRIRSGSLLAPMLAHWAVNGLGVIFLQVA
jgi:membrane protease YdiL (CAAX protease family)